MVDTCFATTKAVICGTEGLCSDDKCNNVTMEQWSNVAKMRCDEIVLSISRDGFGGDTGSWKQPSQEHLPGLLEILLWVCVLGCWASGFACLLISIHAAICLGCATYLGKALANTWRKITTRTLLVPVAC